VKRGIVDSALVYKAKVPDSITSKSQDMINHLKNIHKIKKKKRDKIEEGSVIKIDTCFKCGDKIRESYENAVMFIKHLIQKR